ncbi:hypothetical protein BABINDRAFT_65513 [Babjeviella inositovora NRRL Y-12698]|uniref:Anaphase-promoting complex subunit 4-like WD40 domain-containing protein n=1 Tax=Babjeviella inositovora NRRL Y-12698 TaxID=984486 RepID=A0A1E3QKH7_9ASCO|nr:uncharacterized protein BABINDRAFT_65513 [Babjeviella inositovora NRRL Y-12698]ODQ78191.1 hypothetical protein BABINDRAFT_65513 [Babjeviella inositovora NRRL Y-12698]
MSLFGSAASNTTSTMATEQDLVNDITVASPPEDSVSDLAWSPQAELLAVTSWDKKVRIYEVNASGQSQGRAVYDHEAPALSCRWSPDGTKVLSGGADKAVRLFDVSTQQLSQIGAHDGAVKAVRFVECGPSNTPCAVSGSWDKTLKYWDMRQQQPITTIQLPERVYAMDASQKLLVAGLADRHIVVIDLNNPQQIFKQSQSPLKWQTRSIACYLQGNGYALGSIEGRCSIQYVDDAEQAKLGFSFRCHRQQQTVAGRSESHVYALNSIAIHPVYGTFSTAGSDGCFNYWDKDARHRLKGFPSLKSSISATAFNRNGTIFAYALSYDWSKGYEFNTPEYPTMIKLHPVKDDEIKQRAKKK